MGSERPAAQLSGHDVGHAIAFTKARATIKAGKCVAHTASRCMQTMNADVEFHFSTANGKASAENCLWVPGLHPGFH